MGVRPPAGPVSGTRVQDALISVVAVGLAWAVRAFVDPYIGDLYPFATFFLAVVAAALVGGLRTGLLATALGFAISWYWFIPPRGTFRLTEPQALYGLVLYAAVSLAIVAFGEGMRRAQQRVHVQQQLLRQREAESRAAADELQSIYDASPVGMALIDRNLRYVRINSRLAEINGRSVADHLGKTIFEVIPEAAATVEPLLRGILETGEPVTGLEASVVTEPAGLRHFWVSWFPLRGSTGEIVGVNALIMEITDRKRDEDRIRELVQELTIADRRKDEFLAVLAHELRGPLAPIVNVLELLATSGGDEALREEAREIIRRQVDQLVRLVDDLLDVSRITRDKLTLRLEHVELGSLVRQAVENCRLAAEQARHRITLDVPPGPVYVNGDPVRLTQVFTNLIGNACKYTPSGGGVAVRIAPEGAGRVVVTVRDTGIGIAAEDLDRVFEMFAQVGRSLEWSHGGLGIGLTLVKRLVEMHGGTVAVHSEGVGRGSEFTVRLPTVPAPVPADPQPAGRVATTGRRILVVDDSPDTAASLALLLRHAGHETKTAGDGEEALALVSS
ncbi:MAG TPA: ATP-binding protein, partial [bacterium]|nr:ATP-binding protein [bacterium]